jgi:hypothetical protein
LIEKALEVNSRLRLTLLDHCLGDVLVPAREDSGGIAKSDGAREGGEGEQDEESPGGRELRRRRWGRERKRVVTCH